MVTLIKIYGYPKSMKGLPEMYEVPYTEYDFDTCEIISEGTEDFSPERYRSYMKTTVLEKVKDIGEKHPSGNTKWDRYGLTTLRASRADYPKARRLLQAEITHNADLSAGRGERRQYNES